MALADLAAELALVLEADAAEIETAEPELDLPELRAECDHVYGARGALFAARLLEDARRENRCYARQQEGEHVRLRELAARLYGSPSP